MAEAVKLNKFNIGYESLIWDHFEALLFLSLNIQCLKQPSSEVDGEGVELEVMRRSCFPPLTRRMPVQHRQDPCPLFIDWPIDLLAYKVVFGPRTFSLNVAVDSNGRVIYTLRSGRVRKLVLVPPSHFVTGPRARL